MPSENDRAHIHLKVGAEKKESWESHVERREDVSSLSALIRLAVSKEISGQYDEQEQQIDEFVDVLNDIQSELTFQNEQLDMLRSENIERGEMEEMLDETTSELKEFVNNE